MAPSIVPKQGDFTVIYRRFNGIFNALYASGPVIDISIDSAPQYFRGRCIGLRSNLNGWVFNEEQTTLFVDNCAPSYDTTVKPPTETDMMCQRGVRILLQELDTRLSLHHHTVSSWDTVARKAGKSFLNGLSILLRYAGHLPERTAPQGGLSTIEDWITTNLMTDEYPVTKETKEARQAFRVVWPYFGFRSSSIVDGRNSSADYQLCMDDLYNYEGEEDGSDVEVVESDDEDMDRLQEATEKLMVIDSEAMEIS